MHSLKGQLSMAISLIGILDLNNDHAQRCVQCGTCGHKDQMQICVIYVTNLFITFAARKSIGTFPSCYPEKDYKINPRWRFYLKYLLRGIFHGNSSIGGQFSSRIPFADLGG